ncbi:MAG: diacylglycerol kinase family protein [Planctomycetaceae bacterium]
MSRTIAFIVNPQARGGRLGRAWPQIFALLQNSLSTFDQCRTLISKQQGDCRILAQEAALSGASHVIAVGGDGTLNEVVNGLLDADTQSADGSDPADPILGLLPYGTGGDFRTAIQMPFEITKAADVFQHGTVRSLDVGRVECAVGTGQMRNRAFLNVASCGISAEVSKRVNASRFRIGSRLPYFLATLKALLRYRNAALRITLDDGRDVSDLPDVKVVAIANGPWFGGNMNIAPGALPDDGLFEVIAIRDPGFLTSLRHLRHLYDGTLKNLPEVTAWQASTVRIECLSGTSNVAIELDGETPGILPATFSIQKNAIRMIVPSLT